MAGEVCTIYPSVKGKKSKLYMDMYNKTGHDRKLTNFLYAMSKLDDVRAKFSKDQFDKLGEIKSKDFMDWVQIDNLIEDQNLLDSAKQQLQAVDAMECDMDSMFRFKDLLREIRKQQIEAVVKLSIEELESRSELAKQSVKQAKESGKTVGRKAGAKVTSTKEGPAKELIKSHDKHFVKDPAEIWKTSRIMEEAGISRPTYRKYLKDLMQEQVRMLVLNKFRQKQMAAKDAAN